MQNVRLTLWILLILSFATAIHAQETCPAVVQRALENAADNCGETGLNQACYGHIQLSAAGRTDDFQFEQAGDTADVAAVESISLTALDESSGLWGIALMNLQANLPGTLPGQGVRLLLFGDVSVENAVPPVTSLTVSASTNTRIRSSPSSATDTNIMAGVSAGEAVIANGRTENGEWLRVRYTFPQGHEIMGWMAAVVLNGAQERMALPVVEVGAPVYGQMQAFYLTTGIGQSGCAELPPDGLLIQTPQGAGMVDFLINEVRVSLGSTAFLETVDNKLVIALLGGRGVVSAAGVRQFVPAGTMTTVQLSDDGRRPVDAPTFPEPYDFDRLGALPVDVAQPVVLVPEPFTVAEPVAEAEVEAAVVETFAPYGGLDGVYDMVQGSVTVYVQPNYTGGFCNGAAPFVPNVLRFTENGLDTFGRVWPRIAPGVYGDPRSAHEALRALPGEGQELGAITFYMTSISSITIEMSSAINNQSGNRAACSGVVYARWTGPPPAQNP